MDFIKKHYEKLVLALALLALIGSAAFLAYKVSALTEAVEEGRRFAKGKPLEPTDVGPYTNAIAWLLSPPIWADNPVDPFHTGDIITSIATNNIPTDGGGGEKYNVLGVSRRPFKLVFKTYLGEGHSFQINVLTYPLRTYFVDEVGMPITDQFGKTGFSITKFEHKTEMANVPGVGGPREVDVSELTVQREGEDPIVLVYNRVTEEKLPVANIQCSSGGSPYAVSRGQEFGCGANTYIVVDITPTQVIIMDKLSKEKHIHSIPGVGK